jgi:hypothetical protein
MVPDPAIARAWHEQAKVRPLAPREAYAMAVAAERIRERQVEVGYRLYWMGVSIYGSQDVYAQPSGYAVVGRHGSCDVVLEQDERAVSLRHVLVRAAALDDGFPVLSVLDLQTTAGFELSDGSKQRSIAATGPVVFRVGTCSLVALPSSGRYPDELPVPVVERGERAPHRVAPVRIAEAVQPAPAKDVAPLSRITLLPHSVDFSSRRSEPLGAHPAPRELSERTGDGYEVILQTHQRRVGVRLSTADLDHGVLIGRAEKCVDEGLRSILSDNVSRVHVLLIREKGQCHLYDCASLVGTFANGQRVRCLPLSDDGTTAQLASRSGVTLHWRAL